MTTAAFTLSEREAEVYILRAQGLKIREIAARLGIAYETARIHDHRAREKSELMSIEKTVWALSPKSGACPCGSPSQPCQRCYGKCCQKCHEPIYRDESYAPTGGAKDNVIHLRCRYISQPRPDYMPNPAAHNSLPAPDPRE